MSNNFNEVHDSSIPPFLRDDIIPQREREYSTGERALMQAWIPGELKRALMAALAGQGDKFNRWLQRQIEAYLGQGTRDRQAGQAPPADWEARITQAMTASIEAEQAGRTTHAERQAQETEDARARLARLLSQQAYPQK